MGNSLKILGEVHPKPKTLNTHALYANYLWKPCTCNANLNICAHSRVFGNETDQSQTRFRKIRMQINHAPLYFEIRDPCAL